jgi:7-keto-8-aminopelargonate synthetase-like enzyme
MANKVQLADQVFTAGRLQGVMQLSIEDASLGGSIITIQNQNMVNFGSCSYLGLELDERLKNAAIEAIRNFGTQFSSSRGYVSLGLYDELEDLLAQIYGHPVLLAPTTSLAHISALPTLVGANDAVLFDYQVHTSVNNAMQLLKSNGVMTKAILHNDMVQLEDNIKKLSHQYDKVWYLADGIYSMFGDLLPAQNIEYLLNTYKNFHLYVDDAHGMSWSGKNGSGYVLNNLAYNSKIVVATSLAKGFGSCGGVLIFSNEDDKRKVRNAGAGLLFSGPLQPAVLGASIASAKIHLTDEINSLQSELHEKMRFFEQKIKENDLLMINPSFTPIYFVGVGKLEVGFNLCKRMMNKGFYLNIGLYPAVPYKNTGMRITINRNLSYEDIERMVNTLTEQYYLALADEKSSKAEVISSFGRRNAKAPIYPTVEQLIQDNKIVEKALFEMAN